MVNLVADIIGTLIAMAVYSFVMLIYYRRKNYPKDVRRSRTAVSAVIFGVLYFIIGLIISIS